VQLVERVAVGRVGRLADRVAHLADGTQFVDGKRPHYRALYGEETRAVASVVGGRGGCSVASVVGGREGCTAAAAAAAAAAATATATAVVLVPAARTLLMMLSTLRGLAKTDLSVARFNNL
jgi:hypothetical protein